MAITLSNEQFDKLMASYNAKQLSARALAGENRAKAYEAIPALKDLDNEVLKATESLRGDELKNSLSKIKEKRLNLLKEAGFPEDFLEIHYECPDCKDTGFIEGEHCHCFIRNVNTIIYTENRLQTVFYKENFDNFDLSLYEDQDEEALSQAKHACSAAREFADGIILGDRGPLLNLMIMGSPGTGKTFLCNCIAKELIDARKFVVYLTASSLFEIFEKNTYGSKKTKRDFSVDAELYHFSNLFDADLLIIDDLGSEISNSFTVAKIFELLNKRMIYGAPTLISTNLSMRDLENKYTQRIISRIFGDYNIVRLSGDDLRFKQRKRLYDDVV